MVALFLLGCSWGLVMPLHFQGLVPLAAFKTFGCKMFRTFYVTPKTLSLQKSGLVVYLVSDGKAAPHGSW